MEKKVERNLEKFKAMSHQDLISVVAWIVHILVARQIRGREYASSINIASPLGV